MNSCDTRGFRLHYEDGGEGPALLVLSGLMASPFLWPRALMDRLRRSFRVVMVSHRGTGHSECPEQPFTMGDLADDALAVLDALGVERAHVLGHSMGGMVAQTLALDTPERVERLVLCSTSPGGPQTVAPDFASAMVGSLSSGGATSMGAALFPMLFGEGFLDREPGVLNELAEGWVTAPTPFATGALQLGAAARFDALPRLGEITHPTLVLHGTEDGMLLVLGGRLVAQGIPGARLEEFEGVGHFLPFEAPERMGDLVEEFLGGQVVRG